MALEYAVAYPSDVLSRGIHSGFEWVTMHNGSGCRCGYVRLPLGHPWHGQDRESLTLIDVHGGITYSGPDEVPLGDEGHNAWWIGFDCSHARDLPDLDLPMEPAVRRSAEQLVCILSGSVGLPLGLRPTVKNEAYVVEQCWRLCESAAECEGILGRWRWWLPIFFLVFGIFHGGTQMAENQDSRRSKRKEAEESTLPKAPDRVHKRFKPRKTSITLSEELTFKMDVVASKRRMDRGALAEELLSPHFKGVVVQFRGGIPCSAGMVEDGEGESDA
jgi:hypothetical protein